MSGPSFEEQIYRRDAENFERAHIQNMRRLADRIEEGSGMWRTKTRDEYPDLSGEKRRAIVALLRAKADKIEAHLDAIDAIMSDEFSDLVHDIEWCSTGDYGSGRVAKAWDEYDK